VTLLGSGNQILDFLLFGWLAVRLLALVDPLYIFFSLFILLLVRKFSFHLKYVFGLQALVKVLVSTVQLHFSNLRDTSGKSNDFRLPAGGG
jgi:hypothetical protein